MAEFSQKLESVMKQKGWDNQKAGKTMAARELGVSRASFYNYWNKQDLPSFEVLKRAHDIWGLEFDNIDFGPKSSKVRVPRESDLDRQYVLPFIEAVRENDVQIIGAKSVKPDTLQLTVNIRFA